MRVGFVLDFDKPVTSVAEWDGGGVGAGGCAISPEQDRSGQGILFTQCSI